MALIASLPAPTPTFLMDISYPFLETGTRPGTDTANPEFVAIEPFIKNAIAGHLVWGAGGSGGGGISDFVRVINGVICASYSTVGVPKNQVYSGFTPWQTSAPADFAPGYESPEVGRVIIYDVRWQTDVGAGAPLTSETGFLFVPYAGTAFGGDSWPSGAFPAGGFGIVGRAAAGLQAWQYISTVSVTGAVLETILIAPAVIPDVNEWSHARFTFVASGPGREALLSLDVNGVSIFADKQFGIAALPRLQVQNPPAYLFGPYMRVGDLTGDQLNFAIRMRSGKFKLDGTEVRF
jgi:hypothetical protein